LGCDRKIGSDPDVCQHSSMERNAMRDGNALYQEEQGSNKVLPFFA
jgi:hypothetical protein